MIPDRFLCPDAPAGLAESADADNLNVHHQLLSSPIAPVFLSLWWIVGSPQLFKMNVTHLGP